MLALLAASLFGLSTPLVQRWGLGLALPGGRRREHLVRAGYLFRAQTLEELARQTGVDAAALARTVARFNTLAATGVDTDFGKPGFLDHHALMLKALGKRDGSKARAAIEADIGEAGQVILSSLRPHNA